MTSRKPCILLAEADLTLVGAVRPLLEHAGYKVEAAYSVDAAVARARTNPPDAALAGVTGLDGETLCTRLKELDPSLAVGLISTIEDDSLDWRAEAAGADTCLSGALAGANLESCARSLVRITALRRRIALLEGGGAGVEIAIEAEEPQRGKAKKTGETAIRGASAGGFDFFRRLLLVEVHRSRRYKYPLAFLLASVDRWKELAAELSPRDQAAFLGRVLATAVKSVRDVDLCAVYGTDRFVIFMPHTGADGARLVAGRLAGRIAAMEGKPKVTLSIGLACYEGHGAVSYGGLLREATTALKKVQAEGGNRTELGSKPRARTRVSMT